MIIIICSCCYNITKKVEKLFILLQVTHKLKTFNKSHGAVYYIHIIYVYISTKTKNTFVPIISQYKYLTNII